MPVTYFQSSVSSVLSLAVFPVCRVYPFSLIFFFFLAVPDLSCDLWDLVP